jgi:hypothetical protein
MHDLPLPDLFLKACKRTDCFKLKLNAYLAFKLTFVPVQSIPSVDLFHII